MSNSAECSRCSSDSWSEIESSSELSEYYTAISGESDSEFLPHDDNIELGFCAQYVTGSWYVLYGILQGAQDIFPCPRAATM